MKKLVASIFTAVLALALGVLLVACSGSTSVEGVYKFSSLTQTYDGETMTMEVGKEYDGVTLTEDYYVLTVNKDNTWTMVTTYGEDSHTENGTWEEKDGKYLIKDGDDSLEATLDGKTLTITLGEGVTLTLKK